LGKGISVTDDWKGEHIIRGMKASRVTEDRRTISNIVHEKKRREGTNMSTVKHGWGGSIRAWHLEGKRRNVNPEAS
jgi:hypothetical protein